MQPYVVLFILFIYSTSLTFNILVLDGIRVYSCNILNIPADYELFGRNLINHDLTEKPGLLLNLYSAHFYDQ